MSLQRENIREETEVENAPHHTIKTHRVFREPVVETEPPQQMFEKKKHIFLADQIIWYVLGIIEVLLAFRFVFKFIGANPFSGFVNLVYSLSDPLAIPFSGIIRATVSGFSVFEWSTIIAAIVYWIIAWGLVALFQLMNPATPEKVEKTLDYQ